MFQVAWDQLLVHFEYARVTWLSARHGCTLYFHISSPPVSRGGDPCCLCPWPVLPEKCRKRKQHLGQALQGHPAQHFPVSRGIMFPQCLQTANEHEAHVHIPDLKMLVGKLGEEPLPEEVSYCTSYLRCSHHSPSVQWENEVKAQSPEL